MKLCSSCNNSPLPFLMVLMVAGVSAFVTWLTLGLSITESLPRAAGSGMVFLAVGGTMLHYVLACLKRHCPHGKQHRHPSQQYPRPTATSRSG